MCFILNETICSDLGKIELLLSSILNQLHEKIDDENLFFDAKLILNELVANGAIHGNAQDKNKNIQIKLQLKKTALIIEVADEGVGFCYDKNAYDPMELKCGGRGLVLVDGLSDEFYVEKNRAVSIKYIY